MGPLRGRGLRRIVPFAHRIDRSLRRPLEKDVVVVHGRRMVLDPLDSLGLRPAGAYEYFASQVVLPRLVRPGQIVADVGAHIGYYTLILADLVGPSGRVYAFEPDRTNLELLRENVALNGHRNVRVEQAAVTDRDGEATLYLAHENVADHRLFDVYRDRIGVRVPSLRLDSRLGRRRVDLVKLDIQGAEPVALAGMSEIVWRNQAIALLTEFAPRLLAQFGSDPRTFLERLAELGFALYDLDEASRRLVARDVATLDRRYRAETEDYTNLLCLRGAVPATLAEFTR